MKSSVNLNQHSVGSGLKKNYLKILLSLEVLVSTWPLRWARIKEYLSLRRVVCRESTMKKTAALGQPSRGHSKFQAFHLTRHLEIWLYWNYTYFVPDFIKSKSFRSAAWNFHFFGEDRIFEISKSFNVCLIVLKRKRAFVDITLLTIYTFLAKIGKKMAQIEY